MPLVVMVIGGYISTDQVKSLNFFQWWEDPKAILVGEGYKDEKEKILLTKIKKRQKKNT